MKKFTFLLMFLILGLAALSQDGLYSRVKIFAGEEELRQLLSAGIGADVMDIRPGAYVVCELNEREIQRVRELGLRFEVMIPDVKTYYKERNAPYLDKLEQLARAEYILNRDWPVPDGFSLGTVGGFCSIDQMNTHLDNMIATYPDLISPKYYLPLTTHEGRQIVWLKISDNPTADESEPEVLYSGMHHAREAIGMQNQLFFMYYLLENYDTDPEIQYLVDNFELYFMPVVNMDGYAYNIQTDPSGGGMWRKNRRDNGSGSYGVDLNRNYGYMWGYDNEGSSPDPWDETYRGPSAFSEPCNQGVRDFCNAHEFKIALNYHSYAGLLLYAWGYTPVLPEDNDIMYEYGRIMTKENHYTFGPANTTIYPTNGSSDDWMYGEQVTKDKIFAYTPEMGASDDGFWPPVNRIIPLCQESMWQNIMAAKLSGPYATATDLGPSIVEETTGIFTIETKRIGLSETGTYSISIQPLNDAIASIGDPLVYTDLALMETRTGTIDYTLKEGILSGEEIIYLLSVNNGYITDADTIHKFYGTPVVVFEDTASSMENWTSSKWNITGAQYHSPYQSITDSPQGNYNDYENNMITLTETIDLTTAVYAVLNFWAKWEIEAGYDYVQVLASSNGGSTWIPLEGNYTHAGTGYQQEGEPVYDGIQSDWVQEEISLAGFLGQEIKLRFVLVSDVYVSGDGFYWDDMTVTIIDESIGIGEIPGNDRLVISGPRPMPAGETVGFGYRMENAGGKLVLKVFDITGHEMLSRPVSGAEGTIRLDVGSWDPGMYFYSFSLDGKPGKTGKMIINR